VKQTQFKIYTGLSGKDQSGFPVFSPWLRQECGHPTGRPASGQETFLRVCGSRRDVPPAGL